MKWEYLLLKVADEPAFRTGFLAAGETSLGKLRLQLSRWVKAGKLIQLRKGLYTLAEPYRKTVPHPFTLANVMKKASYVSLQSALSYYAMIPEHVPTVTSVTTQRPERVKTPLGQFVFRHVRKDWFHGFRQIELGSGQRAFVATPEKALLDLAYLTPGADNYNFLAELRLQNLEQLDINTMLELADKSKSAKLCRTAKLTARLTQEESAEDL